MPAPSNKESTMSERPEGTKYQVNVKSPAGALLNLYASTAAELSQQLEDLEAVIPQIAALEGVLNAASAAGGVLAPPTGQTPGNSPSRPSNGPSSPPASLPGNGSAAPSCNHGPRVYKEGISKAGKPFRLWACTSRDRSDQCPPEWVNN